MRKYSNRGFAARYQRLAPEAKLALAKAAETDYAYLRQIAHGSRQPGPELALRLAKALNVTPGTIRPDLWEK